MPIDPVGNPQYVPPSYDLYGGGGGFSAIPAPIANSGAKAIDQLTGVGFGVTILLILVAVLGLANWLQFKRNNSLVDQMFSIVPNATATVLQAVADFKQAIKDMKG